MILTFVEPIQFVRSIILQVLPYPSPHQSSLLSGAKKEVVVGLVAKTPVPSGPFAKIRVQLSPQSSEI